MKKAKKPVFFIVFALIIAFAASVILGFTTQYGDITKTRIKGVNDIRLGIDIQGGVDFKTVYISRYQAESRHCRLSGEQLLHVRQNRR